MKPSLQRALIIARREYVTTVRRPQFLFTVLFTPTLFFLITFVTSRIVGDSVKRHARESRVVAVVDSADVVTHTAGSFHYDLHEDGEPTPAPSRTGAGARAAVVPPASVRLDLRPFTDQHVALEALRAGAVNLVVTIPADFLATGALRQYETHSNLFSSGGPDRPLRAWLTHELLAGRMDSLRTARLLTLGQRTRVFVADRTGAWQLKDERREMIVFFLPFIIGFMLSMSILYGGQYMLQSLAEEKETRILESMLCTVTPDDLMVGKMLGLGGAGLTLVGTWALFGLASGGGALALGGISIPLSIGVLAAVYFLLGYLFFGSLMTGIGAIANNLREAQQISMVLTLLNVSPFWVVTALLNEPNGPLAVGMSLFPPTAPCTMMMRLVADSLLGSSVPPWQLGASIALLAATALAALVLSARVFRIGLLLYGKTPNLPEILRLLRKD